VRRRDRNRLVLVSAPFAIYAALSACAAAPPNVASPNDQAHPHAPGVGVDPVMSLPKPADSGSTARGIVVLTEPMDTRAARRVVNAFYAAVVDEATDDMTLLCEPTAQARISRKSRPERLIALWQRRFERLDYHALSTEVFYRESEMEVHTARDAAAVGTARSLPELPKAAEVLIRTPIIGGNSTRLFGNDLVFLLRPGPAGYKIAQVYEDFRLP
jgi:hypothetical protein